MIFIDNLLNRITMYRLMLYYLYALAGIAAIFGAFKVLPYDPFSIIFSVIVLTTICWLANEAFARFLKAPTNAESAYITAAILTLIIPPATLQPFSSTKLWFLIWAGIFAMASKYILAIKKQHIFNPAAIAAVITALALNQYASWWVGGNLPMLGFIVVGGLLVVRKIQRFDLLIAFLAASFTSFLLTNLAYDPTTTIQKALIHTSLLFFAFVMLTEPLTTPPTRPLRITYGLLVGALFPPAIHFGSAYSTPELALTVGNIFSFAVNPKGKHLLVLKSKHSFGNTTLDFAFATDGTKIKFKPGQYMEWTLPHSHTDTRGNRRYFTVASSPTESDIHLGVRFYEGMSSFKKKMHALEPGESMMGGGLAGDFTLPRDTRKKLAFIAGGIGITPFRSMAKYLSDRGERRDVMLLYSNRFAADIAYAETFDEATRTVGFKTIYAITDEATDAGMSATTKAATRSARVYNGRIDAELIKREVPDYRYRTFYISGPHTMVVSFEKTLRELGVPLRQIKTDFFSGYA